MISTGKKNNLLITGIILGIVYGMATRFIFGKEANIASLTYLFLFPAILGIIPLIFTDEEKLRSYKNIIFIPWLTMSSFFLTLLLSGVEDVLCLMVLCLPFFLLATIGSLLYKLIRISRRRKKGKTLVLVLLPFLFIHAEQYFKRPVEKFRIESKIDIYAPTEHIWNNIVEVKEITSEEYKSGFFNHAGIPRPISATVTRRGKGGHRTGTFQGGLTFIETITEYKENRRISFFIEVDTATVRQKVFDQHILKGNYFSFVDATYEITVGEKGKCQLTLSSVYQLNSTINFYGQFWGDIIISDFQERLLKVLKNRCDVTLKRI